MRLQGKEKDTLWVDCSRNAQRLRNFEKHGISVSRGPLPRSVFFFPI